MLIRIRPAMASDAASATEVVRRSIRELCIADHQNDPSTLDRWLANKTPVNLEAWIRSRDNRCIVGEIDGKLRGIGLLHSSGEVRLFYLAPGAQRRGLGRAIHAALEDHARSCGMPSVHLCGTHASRPFYEAMGYVESAPRQHLHGQLWCHPYIKRLQYPDRTSGQARQIRQPAPSDPSASS